MANLADLKVSVTGDLSGLDRSFAQAEKDVARFSGTTQKAMAGVEREMQRAGVSATGFGRSVSDAADRAGSSFDRAGRSLGAFVGGLGALYAAGRGAQAFVQMADEATRLEGRLRLVTNSTSELTSVQQQLFRVSQETRSEFASNVELYARAVPALKQLGATQKETIDFTRLIGQAFALSGASGAEASSAIVQLSQALGSGTLRGDEFNSINEQGARVMQALADSMGITRGQLRGLAEEGKLTSEVVFKGLLSQAPKLEAEFAKVPRTVGAAMIQLRNDLLMTVDGVNKSTEATAGLVAQVDELRQIVSSPEFASGLISIASEVLRFATDAADAVRELKTVNEELTASSERAADRVSTNMNTLAASMQSAGDDLLELAGISQTSASNMGSAFEGAADLMHRSFAGASQLAVTAVAGIAASGPAARDAFMAAWTNFPDLLRSIGVDAVNAFIATIQNGLNRALMPLNAMVSGINAIRAKIGQEPIDLFQPIDLPKLSAEYSGAGADVAKVFADSLSANTASNAEAVNGAFASYAEHAKTALGVVASTQTDVTLRRQEDLSAIKESTAGLERLGQSAAEAASIAGASVAPLAGVIDAGVTKPSKEAEKALREAEAAKKALFSEADAAVAEFFPMAQAEEDAARLTEMINDTSNGLSDLQRPAFSIAVGDVFAPNAKANQETNP